MIRKSTGATEKLSGSDRGHSTIEVVLVLPFLLLLIFGGIEIAKGLEYYQNLDSLSREAANISRRRCITRSTGRFAPGCMDNFLSAVDPALPGAVVIISVYRLEEGIPVRTDIISSDPEMSVEDMSEKSKWNEGRAAELESFLILDELASDPEMTSRMSSLEDSSFAVISEAFYSHPPLSRLSFMGSEYYDVTIF